MQTDSNVTETSVSQKNCEKKKQLSAGKRKIFLICCPIFHAIKTDESDTKLKKKGNMSFWKL